MGNGHNTFSYPTTKYCTSKQSQLDCDWFQLKGNDEE